MEIDWNQLLPNAPLAAALLFIASRGMAKFSALVDRGFNALERLATGVEKLAKNCEPKTDP